MGSPGAGCDVRGIRLLAAVVGMNLRSLPQRRTNAFVLMLSIAGVVAVFAGVLAMSAGLNGAMRDSGRSDRVIVLRAGSMAEITSAITREQVKTIEGIAGIRVDANGLPLVAGEAVAPLTLVEKGTGMEVNGTLRGVERQTVAVRPEIQIVAGRAYAPGKHEVVVGSRALAQFDGLALGGELQAYGTRWKVVGVFKAGGSFRESELLTDADALMSVSHRPVFQNVTAVLSSARSFGSFRKLLAANPSLSMEVFPESEFLSRESASLNRLLAFMAYVMGGIMALGATFVALNATYSSVNDRRREIATLRAVGFAPAVVVSAIIAEALLLALVGGLLGAFVAWFAFNGNTMSTTVGLDVHQLAFTITVTLPIVLLGLAAAIGIGAVGGILPAIHALRTPVAVDLRAV
jgi:putative ABC transport system permease protein